MKKNSITRMVEGSLNNGRIVTGQAVFHYEKTQYEAPKSYKKIGLISYERHSNYDSGLVTIYENKQKILKFEVYHDGNFYPYFGTIEFMDQKVKDINNRSDLIFVVDSQDVAIIHNGYHGTAKYNSFFVKIDNGEYLELYGLTNTVPYLDQPIHRIF